MSALTAQDPTGALHEDDLEWVVPQYSEGESSTSAAVARRRRNDRWFEVA